MNTQLAANEATWLNQFRLSKWLVATKLQNYASNWLQLMIHISVIAKWNILLYWLPGEQYYFVWLNGTNNWLPGLLHNSLIRNKCQIRILAEVLVQIHTEATWDVEDGLCIMVLKKYDLPNNTNQCKYKKN